MMKKPKMPKAGDGMKDATMAMPRFGARAMRPGGMAKGGGVHPDAAMDKKLIRKEIARAEKMEDKAEAKGMKKGAAVKKMAVGGLSIPPGMNMSGAARTPTQIQAARNAPPPTQSSMSGKSPTNALQAAPAGVRPQVSGTPLNRPMMSQQSVKPMPAGGRPMSDAALAGKAMQEFRASQAARAGRPFMPMKKGGSVKMARGGGVEVKGKTKGKFI